MEAAQETWGSWILSGVGDWEREMGKKKKEKGYSD